MSTDLREHLDEWEEAARSFPAIADGAELRARTARLAGFVRQLVPAVREAEAAITRVRELHKPEVPPEGSKWVSGGHGAHCEGCSTGDPFLDQPWPCPTITALDGGEET